MEINFTVPVNDKGMNTNIKFKKFEEEKMRELGFSDYNKEFWSYRATLTPGISFNLSISKTEDKGTIDVLYEDYGQPYDYQQVLYKNRFNVYAMDVHSKVQLEMKKFLENGIIENYTMGDYI